MALNALWPLIASAEPRTDFFSIEICSVNGKAAGAAVGKLPSQLPESKHQNMHCVFCTSGMCNAMLLGTRAAIVVPSVATLAVFPAVDARRQRHHAFLFAESRAPPVLPRL